MAPILTVIASDRRSFNGVAALGCYRIENVTRNTNVQPHSVAACRVGWLTLVPGGGLRMESPIVPHGTEKTVCTVSGGCNHLRVSRARVRRVVIAPVVGLLGRGLGTRMRTSRSGRL